jgi:sulfide:quinone oxidoreductase
MNTTPPRVVVLGSGVAALEVAFLLERRLSGRVDLEVVSDRDDLVLRSNLVYVPFGAEPSASTIDTADVLMRKGIRSTPGRVEGVDTSAGRVHLAGAQRIPYEHLVIATGAAPGPQEIPGLAEHAVGIWDAPEMLTLRERFGRVRGLAREGVRQRVLFVVPRHSQWSLPLYEVALMFDTWLGREHAREPVEIGFVTHEASFAKSCGRRMHEVVASEFARRRIEGHTSRRLVEARRGGRRLAQDGRAVLVTASGRSARRRFSNARPSRSSRSARLGAARPRARRLGRVKRNG